jgi:type III secretion protein J
VFPTGFARADFPRDAQTDFVRLRRLNGPRCSPENIMPVAARFAVACLFVLLLGACRETVYSGLAEGEINEMLVVLANNGVEARKEPEGKGLWSLTVDERLLARGIDLLAANGLPRAVYRSMGDIFKKESMVSTPTEERARLVYAISQELAGTVAAIDGVLNARVHLVLPETDTFGNKLSPAKASIFIKHRQDVDLSNHVNQIKRMVENSVQDLQYEHISVFLFPSASPPLPPLPEAFVLGIAVDPRNELPAWGAVALIGVLTPLGAFFAVRRLRRKRKAGQEENAQS